MRNYRSLVIAGIGTIGRGLVTLGAEHFSLFDHVFAVDRDENSFPPLRNPGIICRPGDISDPQFLRTLMTAVPAPALFVYLCSGTNNIRIRSNLAGYDAAYVDSCASAFPDTGEYRFSRLMPHTYTEIAARRPHWICWGINPGLVEIIVRRILSKLPDRLRAYDVAVYEFDRLESAGDTGKGAVGWSPEALVEETMLAPTLEIVAGLPREDAAPGARSSMVSWEGRHIKAKVVGHEDIWNMAEIPGVRNGRFYYSLNSGVMDILDMENAAKAGSMLYTPAADVAVSGLEQVAVQVNEKNMGAPKTLVWTVDHRSTWKLFGVNGVQYQTAKSLLLAILLLQRTAYGLAPPAACNASNLPISSRDWPLFDRIMEELDINWRDGTHLNLHVVGEGQPEADAVSCQPGRSF